MSHETHTNNEGKQERESVHLSGEETYFETDYYLVGGQGNNNHYYIIYILIVSMLF